LTFEKWRAVPKYLALPIFVARQASNVSQLSSGALDSPEPLFKQKASGEMTMVLPRRKKIPFKYLAGSCSGPRNIGEIAEPQQSSAPTNITPSSIGLTFPVSRLAPTNPVSDFHELFGDKSTPEEKVLTIDDVCPVALPFCPHGIRLTKDECIFEAAYKGRPYCRRINGKSFFTDPKSFECFDCNPCCIHGTSLSPVRDKECFENHQRFSKKCPECDPTITDPALIHAHLYRQRLGTNADKGLIEGYLKTSFGQIITKGGKWFSQGGGSKEIEEKDAVVQGEIPTNIRHGSADSDTSDDLNDWPVDDLGEPAWTGLTDLTKLAEGLRIGETRSMLCTPSRYEVKQSGQTRKWFVVKDGEMLVTAFKSKKAAEHYVNGQLVKDTAGEKIEHAIKDVLPDI
jgi:hypothetical protein